MTELCHQAQESELGQLTESLMQHILIQCAYDKFPDFFFVWALLLIVHT